MPGLMFPFKERLLAAANHSPFVLRSDTYLRIEVVNQGSAIMKFRIEFIDDDRKTTTVERDADFLPRIGERFSGYDDHAGFRDGVVTNVWHKGDGPKSLLLAVVTVDQSPD
jgi:hypothetical protein